MCSFRTPRLIRFLHQKSFSVRSSPAVLSSTTPLLAETARSAVLPTPVTSFLTLFALGIQQEAYAQPQCHQKACSVCRSLPFGYGSNPEDSWMDPAFKIDKLTVVKTKHLQTKELRSTYLKATPTLAFDSTRPPRFAPWHGVPRRVAPLGERGCGSAAATPGGGAGAMCLGFVGGEHLVVWPGRLDLETGMR